MTGLCPHHGLFYTSHGASSGISEPCPRCAALDQVYKKNGREWIDFNGTRGDYKSELLFMGTTDAGNLKVGEVNGWVDGKPCNIKRRLAKLRREESHERKIYWYIEDGTGSLILRPRQEVKQ
jgi:hypothetical protein